MPCGRRRIGSDAGNFFPRDSGGENWFAVGAEFKRHTVVSVGATVQERLRSGRLRAHGQVDDSSYFRKGLAGDWRRALSDAQIAMVHDVCSAELKANGYDLD